MKGQKQYDYVERAYNLCPYRNASTLLLLSKGNTYNMQEKNLLKDTEEMVNSGCLLGIELKFCNGKKT